MVLAAAVVPVKAHKSNITIKKNIKVLMDKGKELAVVRVMVLDRELVRVKVVVQVKVKAGAQDMVQVMALEKAKAVVVAVAVAAEKAVNKHFQPGSFLA